MSDTDDTDLLLLIPPNFFSVQSSDSEDLALKRTDFKRHKYEIERTVVNDLITQVNELESRVCAIESVDSSCSTSCVNGRFNGSVDSFDIKNAKLMHDNTSRFVQMSKDSQLTGSLENIGLDKISPLFDNQRSPIKLRNRYSLPATPVSVEKKSNYPFEVVREFVSNHNLVRSGTSNSNISQVIDTSNSNLGSQNDSNSNVQNGNCEINSNEFETITTNNSEEISLRDCNVLAENESNRMNEQVNGDSDSVKVHTKPSFQINRSNMLNSNDESELFLKNLRNEPDCNQSNKSTTKHLELCEVDKLLKEMEETQCEIERKLKTREIHYNMSKGDDTTKATCTYQTGTTIGSVPNLGFGVRNILYSNNEKETGDPNKRVNINRPNSSDPGIEEICTQTKITTLGRSPDRNSEFVNIKYISPLASPLLKTPIKSDRPGISDNNEPSYYKPRKRIIFSPSKLPAKSLSRSPKKLGSDQVTSYKFTNSNLESGSLGNNSDYFKREQVRIIDDNDTEDDNSSADEKKIGKEPRKQIRIIKSNARLFDSSEDNPNLGHDMRPNSTTVASRRVLGLRPSDTRGNHFMSLSELWNDQKSDETNLSGGCDPVKLSQKLEEEKFKRQHCEQLIHELQKRILEDQERIAVAVQIDREKDVAIKRLWNGWQQLSTHWHELEEQRNNLSNQLESQTKAFETQAEDIKKKVELWEKELSQALDLAAGYKEKCQLISQEREEFRLKMESKFQEALDKLSATKDESVRYFEEKNNLMEKLTRFETESEKDKQLVAEYQKKLADVEHKLNQLEAEICILRQQKENLTLKLRDEHTRTKAAQEQKMALQQMVDDYKKREKLLKDEVKNASERLELARVELRTLYQGQLEAVVKDKLREFQSQLNAAEAALRAELLSREKEIAEQAAQQCYNLAESHKLEMAAVEERFRSQLKMLNMKMKEIEYQKYEAEKKFSNEKEMRREIAQKLHSIMETQWRQALKIISSTSASGDGKDKVESKYEDIELDLDALNKSLSNSGSSSNQDTTPFIKNDGAGTYRLVPANSAPPNRNSNLHHHHNLQQQQQQQRQQQQQQQHHELQHGLKKYIHMLLDRTPGNPVPGELNRSATSLGQDEMTPSDFNMTSDSVYSFFSNKTEPPPKEQERTPIQQKAFMDTIGEGKQNLQSARVYRSQKPWK